MKKELRFLIWLTFLSICSFVVINCSKPEDSEPEPMIEEPVIEYGEMLDPRDGQRYRTISFNGQEWMAENLNFGTKNSWCYFESPRYLCREYGRLYLWNAAIDACPPGWRLPSREDWIEMALPFGGIRIGTYNFPDSTAGRDAYKALIEGGSTGFDALLGGERNLIVANDYFGGKDFVGTYWTSTETRNGWGALPIVFYKNPWNNPEPYVYLLVLNGEGHHKESWAYSCRCVKEN